MKDIYKGLLLFALLFCAGCDKNFEAINTNPTQPSGMDPVYQFSKAQQSSAISNYHYQGAIVQQIITPYGGVLEGGNRNTVNEANASATFNSLFTGPIRELTDIVDKLEADSERSNLYNMARIWRAYCFQYLVDTYGDVPYSEAAKAYLDSKYLPKYDDQRMIYEDILKEYQEATDALSVDGDVVDGDLFYRGDVVKWKRLGNSLLLRAGMRYVTVDPGKAKELVSMAVDPSRGGVMVSNADNAYLRFDATYTNGTSSALLGGERHNYYIGEPLIDFLKRTEDPRLGYTAVKYERPANPLATAGAANTRPADQEGMPYGYDENTIVSAPGFPGKNGSAFNYSQFNRATIIRIDAPEFFVTHAQTELLLAEANHLGYVSTGSVKDHYEAGIRAHMEQEALYGRALDISSERLDAYLSGPEVAFRAPDALEQINTQYWVASLRIWAEAWANFRRSGYPRLSPINFPGADPSVNEGNAGGFIHRLPYPLREKSVNSANVREAIDRMGGDNFGIRVFWDE